jgi:hypothetical protein
MVRLRVLCIVCLAAVLTPRGGQAQSVDTAGGDSAPSAEGRLGGEKAQLVAWRAHDTAATHDRALVAELVSLAGQWQPLSSRVARDSPLSPAQEQERDAMMAVLDALLQMHVALPEETLRNLAPDFANPVAVFLTRMPLEQAAPLSLEFYRSLPADNYALRYVSAAFLALHPPSGFAAELLANTTVQARICVILPGGDSIGEGSAGSYGVAVDPPRDGWPVIGVYRLSMENSDGAFIVVAGTKPIYLTREEVHHYDGNEGRMSPGLYLSADEQRGFIADMLGVTPNEIPWQTDPKTTIEYLSQVQFQNALLAFVDEQQKMYRATAQALQARKLLTASEAAQSLPLVELSFLDARGEDAEPLPKDMDLPARVQWSSSPF